MATATGTATAAAEIPDLRRGGRPAWVLLPGQAEEEKEAAAINTRPLKVHSKPQLITNLLNPQTLLFFFLFAGEPMVLSRGGDGAPTELETSFSHSPRRGGGYASLSQSEGGGGNGNGTSRNGKAPKAAVASTNKAYGGCETS